MNLPKGHLALYLVACYWVAHIYPAGAERRKKKASEPSPLLCHPRFLHSSAIIRIHLLQVLWQKSAKHPEEYFALVIYTNDF